MYVHNLTSPADKQQTDARKCIPLITLALDKENKLVPTTLLVTWHTNGSYTVSNKKEKESIKRGYSRMLN